MRKFGLIGYPLGHSFSRSYFSGKFAREKITGCTYENYPLENINLFEELIYREPDLCGLNVTIPYKSEVIRYLHHLDPEAAEIGAVNVLKIRRADGKIRISGYNSDVTGIRDSIIPHMTDIVNSVLVLGTGGSSKAVIFVLRKLGLNVISVSRERKPGVITYDDLDAGIIESVRLIVNTTPLGMYPDTGTRPEIAYDLLGSRHILFDLVYNPEVTAFLKAGQERGCKTISGIIMLHSQAERAWEIWNDDSL